MNHRRMIRYRRHRGYGASALSFVTACWNGLWKETLFSVSSVSSVVSLLLCLFFLSSCHYARPNLSSEEMPQKTKDSLNYLYERHYTWNTNLELTADSILLECLPIKDTYINLYRGDRVVVAEFAVHPADSVDSVWVKLAHTQDEQGWIREVELKRSFVPTDSISQAIHLFSDTHASYFVVIFALFVGVYPVSYTHLDVYKRQRHQRIVILHQADLRRHLDGNHARQLQIVQLLFKAAAQRGEIVCRLRILWQAGLFRLFHQNGQLLGARLRKLLLACQDIHGEFLKVHLVQLIHFIQHCNIL